MMSGNMGFMDFFDFFYPFTLFVSLQLVSLHYHGFYGSSATILTMKLHFALITGPYLYITLPFYRDVLGVC